MTRCPLRGDPLVFSYPIGESWVKLRDRGMTAGLAGLSQLAMGTTPLSLFPSHGSGKGSR